MWNPSLLIAITVSFILMEAYWGFNITAAITSLFAVDVHYCERSVRAHQTAPCLPHCDLGYYILEQAVSIWFLYITLLSVYFLSWRKIECARAAKLLTGASDWIHARQCCMTVCTPPGSSLMSEIHPKEAFFFSWCFWCKHATRREMYD